MAGRLQAFFNLRYEDRRKIMVMGVVFLLAGISEMVNYTAYMGIFNSRLGTQYLPVMYMIEALLLPLEGWLLSYLSQRVPKKRLMISLYLLFVGIGLSGGAVLLLFTWTGGEWQFFYFILFLVSSFVVRQQTLLMWSTAFDLCPTQQAKRVMPVFVLLAIIGGIVAGILSRVLAPLLGAEMLYLLGAVILLLGFPNFRSALKQYLLPSALSPEEGAEEMGSVGRSMKLMLKTPFLLVVVGVMTLLPAVYYVMEYQYFTAAQSVFHTEEELTAFYGLMVIVLFCGAFVLQLFSAKLMAWLGASNMVLGITAVFFLSFVLAAPLVGTASALFAVSVGYSFTYLLLYYFAEPSFQLFFKMYPQQQRDGLRFTAQSISASAGILLGSGVAMLHSRFGWSLSGQALVGLGMAVILMLLAWYIRRLYLQQLLHYLQAATGSLKNLYQDFVESLRSQDTRKALVAKLDSADRHIQRMTLEWLAEEPDASASETLLRLADRHEGDVRALALAAVHAEGWRAMAAGRIREWLQDPSDPVRAVVARQAAASGRPDKAEWLQLAYRDPALPVKLEALRVWEDDAELETELRQLLQLGGDAAVAACRLVGERRLTPMLYDVMLCMLDTSAALKYAAVRTIGRIGGSDIVTSLMDMLVGADREMSLIIEEALQDAGKVEDLKRFLDSPNEDIWRAAVLTVDRIGTDRQIAELVAPACIRKLMELCAGNRILESIEAAGQEQWTQLARQRRNEVNRMLLDTIWAIMIRYGDERSIPQLRRAIEEGDEETRDHGLEILSEGMDHPRLAGALLLYYQSIQDPGEQRHAQLRAALQESLDFTHTLPTDPWLQAIAVKVGAMKGEAELAQTWEYLNALDKIVFLKQVPLFHEISVEELGRIASIAEERMYREGQFLHRQGESGGSLVMIVEGQVELSGVNDEGVEGTVALLGPMQTFGEAGLFDNQPSVVSAQALLGDVRALEIAGDEAAKLVRQYPDIGVGLLRSVSQRLRNLEHMLLKLS
ncbi:cyclic nucleotide-binding domain-containing protein [Paenibacillus sp. 1P07SE]|uniref:cyclic nucleotide-binding domain-containing protein n=1 Tax=Paenibacillus sp. 1P07SE TaxID=3132209 RepID=UPI0039A5D800